VRDEDGVCEVDALSDLDSEIEPEALADTDELSVSEIDSD